MRLKIIHKIKNCRALWTDENVILAAQGMSLCRVDANSSTIGNKMNLGNVTEQILATSRTLRQLFRLGIHHLWPLSDGNLLVVLRKRILRVNTATQYVEATTKFLQGNKPAHKGVCVTPEGDIFLGEYSANKNRRQPVVLYRSCDGGRTFMSIHEFNPGEVRHIHFIQWDAIEKCLWMGTGDRDRESWILKSKNGDQWEKIGGGSQLWRAVGLAFRPEAVYWGTDAGSDAGKHPNYVMRLDRRSFQLCKILELQGPCHGNAVLKDGTLLVSTGVEGGINEKDRSAHLWGSRDGTAWHEVICFEKDSLPHIVQYGVIRFPQGLEKSEKVIFTCYGLSGAEETTFIAALAEE